MASSWKRNVDGDDTSTNRKRRNLIDVDDSFDNDDHEIKLVTATGGQIIYVIVKRSDTISEIKLKIRNAKAHAPTDPLEPFRQKVPEYTNNTLGNKPIKKESTCESIDFIDIFIKNLEGRIIYCLEVKPSDTIGNVKIMITGRFGHVLMFNDVVLDDKGTLADFNVVDGSTLTYIDIEEGKMEIFVNNTFIRKTISLLVSPKDTITNVKQETCYKEKFDLYKHVPIEERVLIFNGMALEDSGTLVDFHIKAKSTLKLLRRSRRMMEIFIQTFRDGVISMEVNPSYTIGNVKSKIQDKIHIPQGEQELIFNETVLDNFDTIADSDINEGSKLTLVRKSTGQMHIIIDFLGRIINVKAKPSDTVNKVISKIADLEGIPYCQLMLVSDGRRMNDSLTLADYHIREKSTIHGILHQTGG